MKFDEKNKLREHLGKCLVILPNDKYLKKLFFSLMDDFFSEEADENYTNRELGILRGFLTRNCIDWNDSRIDYSELNHIDSNELTDSIINKIPKELLKQKMFFIRKANYYSRNPLEAVTCEIINNEIKSFYNKNKIMLHLK